MKTKLLLLLTFTKGEITAEQQQAARDQYLALRARADAAFRGPEWVIEA